MGQADYDRSIVVVNPMYRNPHTHFFPLLPSRIDVGEREGQFYIWKQVSRRCTTASRAGSNGSSIQLQRSVGPSILSS